jgi:hypothetical protein
MLQMESVINSLIQSPTPAETLRKVGKHKKKRNSNYVFINSKFNTRTARHFAQAPCIIDNKEVPCMLQHHYYHGSGVLMNDE